MRKPSKKRAPGRVYTSPNQLELAGFESPFTQKLSASNRWVTLAGKIPWDEISNVYLKQMHSGTGRPPLSPRLVLGALMIKHICDLSDRETVAQIAENMYMQYFVGYTSFSPEEPFDPSLFVEIRERLGMEQINTINEKIVALSLAANQEHQPSDDTKSDDEGDNEEVVIQPEEVVVAPPKAAATHSGRMITDATVAPQDIAFPTDLNLLNEAREISEELIDQLHKPGSGLRKPRTYRRIARKVYLNTARKKKKSRNELRKAIGRQLRYVHRNLKTIDKLLAEHSAFPLPYKELRRLLIIRCVFQQQEQMYREGIHRVDQRIVSIHQPHVRPMVRGKAKANTEFGSKIEVSLMDGFAFLDDLSWEAFNEGSRLMAYVEQYKKRLGYYPMEVLADQIFCSRDNRAALKALGIRLLAKPLGRPPAVKAEHVRPGERNPIEGKFGQGKNAYGLDRIRARLKHTSESWVASIILVLNLVKLAGQVPLSLWLGTFSARESRLTGQWMRLVKLFSERPGMRLCRA